MARISPLSYLKSPLWAAGVLSADKSFADNPILGSPRLNRMGLHTTRIDVAARLGAMRRARIARALDPADRAALDRDGYIAKRNFLPAEAFAALKREVFGRALPAWEQRQGGGGTVERVVPLPPQVTADLPQLADLVGDPGLLALIRYGAACGGQPTFFLQTIMAGPSPRAVDPQTFLHSDTFHATTKGWLFMHDIGVDDGPFIYVPGSHRMTPQRLLWEREQSLTARNDPDRHHAVGSFRIARENIAALGYAEPVRVAVPANTLVIADTRGFHARAASDHATTRIALHATFRRNPFLPWLGGHVRSLPGLRGRDMMLYLKFQAVRKRLSGRGAGWIEVEPCPINAPPHR